MKKHKRSKGANKHVWVAAGTVAILAIGGATAAAHAAGGSARLGPWSLDHYTAWGTSDAPPADPDSQSGEDNPLNLTQIGQREDRTVVDTPAWDETVVDTPAWDETVVDQQAADRWYTWTCGPSGDHSFPSSCWNPDSGNHNGFDCQPNLACQRDKGADGESDWFYHQDVEESSHVVHHDAVTHLVHKDAITHAEHRWPVLVRALAEKPQPSKIPSPSATPSKSPVTDEETKTMPHKVVKIQHHADGSVTTKVKHYPTDAVEEGY
ncbi:hypothetical protein JCM18899A_42270 [Nocardioides sp. AN3]